MIWLFRLLAAFVFVTFAMTALLHGLLFYESAARDAVRGMRRPFDRARVVTGLGAWARQSGCNLGVALLWPLGLLARPRIRSGAWLPVPREVRHGLPVLVVPGYAMNRGTMRLLSFRIERAKRPSLCVEFPWGRSIEQLGEVLAAGVMELKAATGAEKVDLVCHSRGGLVAFWWIHKMGGAAHVERVVALGTPWSGTKAAAFGLGPSALQMFPGSEFLRLIAGISLDPRITFYSVNGDSDAMILPPGGDELPPPGRNIRLAGLGHSGLVFSHGAWTQIHAALRRTTEDELALTGYDDETQEDAAERAIAQIGR